MNEINLVFLEIWYKTEPKGTHKKGLYDEIIGFMDENGDNIPLPYAWSTDESVLDGPPAWAVDL